MLKEFITKEELIRLGITDVSRDGKTILNRHGKPMKQRLRGKYLSVFVHDPIKYKATPKEDRTNRAGRVELKVHLIVYAWFHGSLNPKLVIDHIDENKLNNCIDNLQELSNADNILKSKSCNTEVKCDLSVPREVYEDELNKYLTEYDTKFEPGKSESKELKTLRNKVFRVRAKLRYYDNHLSDALNLQEQIIEYNLTQQELIEAKHLKAEYLNNVKALGETAKAKNDFALWHECNEFRANMSRLLPTEISSLAAAYKNFLIKHQKDFGLIIKC